MRRLLLRSTLSFALAWTAACADDIPIVPGSSSGDESTTGPGPVVTDGPDPDTTAGDTSSSSGSSSGEPEDSSSSSGGPGCGNDVLDDEEVCDGTNLDRAECTSLGFMGGDLACLPDCTGFDTTRCTPFPCGDDAVDGEEVCDGTNLAGEDCSTQGFAGGTLACAADCSAFDTSACVSRSCGNGAIEGMEACDGTELGGEDCITQGFDGGTLACAPDCSAYDTAGCFTFDCGNDVIEGAEACDGTNLAGSTCEAQGFEGGTLACAPDCSAYDTAGCYVCGDDVVGGLEVCDGADLQGSTCATQGFGDGTLACAPDCSGYDTAGCFTCGDAVVSGTEVCDGTELAGSDCTTEGFDGGTLGCALDCLDFDTAGCYACGNAAVEGPEECDGADLLGNTCVSLDIGFDGGTLACDASCGYDTSGCTRCGDGAIEGAETCDGTNLGGQTCQGLGFDFGALGCTDECNVTQLNCVDTITETEPNDDGMVAVATNDFSAPAANGPFTSDALISAAIGPAGDDDVFAISNPGPGYVVAAIQTYGPVPGACIAGVDTQISLVTAGGMQIAFNDDGGFPNCSLISNILLPPGITLYARIIDFGDNSAIAAYHVHIRMDPVVCGDGIGGPLEQCDDGGNANGDGCSSTCQIEGVVNEVEPNGTSAQADAAGIVINGDVTIGAQIGTIGDQDRFRIDLASPQNVKFETFTTLGQCNNGFNTVLRLYDAAGVQIIADTGPLAGSGIANCAAITFPLPAGTFYVQVEENGNNAPVPTYVLDVDVLDDTGTESEPNEDLLTANANLTGGVTDVYVFGDHTLNADSDFYAIDVPINGSSLRLEIIEGDRAVETCESNNVDSRLTLYDPAGVELANDDDSGRGFCSQIDGTGLVGQQAGAHNLAAGTYYVQVRASTFSQASAAGQFIYRLVATVREP